MFGTKNNTKTAPARHSYGDSRRCATLDYGLHIEGVMAAPTFEATLGRRIDPWWRKARIAARLLLKKEQQLPWTRRDQRLAAVLADDPGVTNRLIDQAVKYFKAPVSP
jgi:hypothetical protein